MSEPTPLQKPEDILQYRRSGKTTVFWDLNRPKDRLFPTVLFGILGLLVPLLFSVKAIDISSVNQLGRFVALAIAALGVDLVWGYTGLLTLFQAMFFCFGGYAIGMHMALHGPLDGEGIPRCLFVVTSEVSGFKLPTFWEPFRTLPVAVLLGLLIPGLAAFVFGYFTFRSRVRGVYFSIITQATTVGAVLIFRRNETRLCGTNGLTNFVSLGGFNLSSNSGRLGLYLLSVACLAGTYFFCKYTAASRLGRLLVAVRDNESRLRFAGYQPVTLKLFAFVAGAMMAGLGGMLYTPQNGIITPYKMEPVESIMMVIWVAFGGRGTLSGAVLGAIIVNYLGSFLTSNLPNAWPFVQGGLFIAVVLFMPDGLVGLYRSWKATRVGLPATTAPSAEDEEDGVARPAGEIARQGAGI